MGGHHPLNEMVAAPLLALGRYEDCGVLAWRRLLMALRPSMWKLYELMRTLLGKRCRIH